jgi:hypothetical protein
MDSRRLLQILGFAAIVAAAAWGVVAIQHMRTLTAYGYICGAAAPHCAACYASLASLALGIGFLAASRARYHLSPLSSGVSGRPDSRSFGDS